MNKHQVPLISIVIINHNGKGFLSRCLNSVLKSNFNNFELIFVDNASTDESLVFVKNNFNNEKIKLIKNDRNYGVPGGRNIGSNKAEGEYLVFLDNDTEVDDNWLDELITVFRNDEKIAVAQSKLLNMHEKNRFDHAGDYLTPFGFLSERSHQRIDTGQFDKIVNIFNAKGAATMIRRSIFEELGRYDDTYFMYLEETDFCLRAWLAGYRVVFAPLSIVWHAFETPLKDTKTYYSKYIVRYYGCKNYVTTLLKNLSSFTLLKILPFHITSWCLLAITFVLKGKPKDGFWILKGLLWNLVHLPSVLKKRSFVQKHIRKITDQEFLNQVMISQGISFYLKKAICYLSNKPFREVAPEKAKD